jgi:hypothetical protein
VVSFLGDIEKCEVLVSFLKIVCREVYCVDSRDMSAWMRLPSRILELYLPDVVERRMLFPFRIRKETAPNTKT